MIKILIPCGRICGEPASQRPANLHAGTGVAYPPMVQGDVFASPILLYVVGLQCALLLGVPGEYLRTTDSYLKSGSRESAVRDVDLFKKFSCSSPMSLDIRIERQM